MEKERSNLKKVILILAGISLCLVIAIYVLYQNNKSSNEEVLDIFKEDDVEEALEESENDKVYVDIKGRVNNPGVYEVKRSARVIDVISLAGGLLDDADTSLLNLAKLVEDEMTIIVYSRDEVMALENEENYTDINNDASIKGEESNSNSLININTASSYELMQINGIGEAKAKAIIDYRNNNGLFQSIDDIKKVTGIGDALFEKIKAYITV